MPNHHRQNPADHHHRKKQLDAEGMVWEPGDEAWETKLAALRSYHRAHGHLAPRQDAVWGERDSDLVPIGQLIANLRRKGGLGKDTERAATRAAQLTAIDQDWNCPWPLDWQRHYRVLADLLDADGALPAIEPGVLFEGDDLGRWLERQANSSWAQLTTEQQERLTALGVKPTARPAPAAKAAAKGAGKASAAFQRGVAALAQYIAREGTHAIVRSHTERIIIEDQQHDVKLGIWVSNTKQRRDKLTDLQRAALAELGVEWA